MAHRISTDAACCALTDTKVVEGIVNVRALPRI